MAWSRPFSGKSPLTYFQTPTHQISLFACLDTLNNFFLNKTQKNLFLAFPANFNCISLFNQIGFHWPLTELLARLKCFSQLRLIRS